MHNRAVLRDVKIQVKKFMETADGGNLDQLQKDYSAAAKQLDKAAAKNVIHRNLASRKKSQLAKLLHAKKKGGAKTAVKK
jgi:small subunit ribosomal protein S20